MDTTHDVMSVIGGIILIVVGIWIIRKFYHPYQHHKHHIDTTKGVVAIGLSTGLIPCPAALPFSSSVSGTTRSTAASPTFWFSVRVWP